MTLEICKNIKVEFKYIDGFPSLFLSTEDDHLAVVLTDGIVLDDLVVRLEYAKTILNR